MGKKNKAQSQPLHVIHTLDVPLKEVSGICLRRDRNGEMSLVAVGDRAASLAILDLQHVELESPEWRTVDIGTFAGSKLPVDDPQIEAVCADGAGHVLLLQESPPRAELLDLHEMRTIASIDLIVKGGDELADSWSDPDGSRGEGVVLLKNGHLLVAKEKHPAVLIEFGPKGATPQGLMREGALAAGTAWPVQKGEHAFVALSVWWPDKSLEKVCDDFSDLEIGPDGRLYLLSDKSATIARIDDLKPGEESASLSASWQLDNVDAKPEGLSFASNGCAVVALDKRKTRNNLIMLDPPIAV